MNSDQTRQKTGCGKNIWDPNRDILDFNRDCWNFNCNVREYTEKLAVLIEMSEIFINVGDIGQYLWDCTLNYCDFDWNV